MTVFEATIVLFDKLCASAAVDVSIPISNFVFLLKREVCVRIVTVRLNNSPALRNIARKHRSVLYATE